MIPSNSLSKIMHGNGCPFVWNCLLVIENVNKLYSASIFLVGPLHLPNASPEQDSLAPIKPFQESRTPENTENVPSALKAGGKPATWLPPGGPVERSHAAIQRINNEKGNERDNNRITNAQIGKKLGNWTQLMHGWPTRQAANLHCENRTENYECEPATALKTFQTNPQWPQRCNEADNR